MGPPQPVSDPDNCILAVDPRMPFDQWVHAVAQRLGAHAAPSHPHRIVWLDTFDWRLWRRGWILEWLGDRGDGRLRLREPGGCRVLFEAPVVQPPRFPAELVQAGLRARLEDVTRPRALLPVAEAQGRLARLAICDDEDKTVLRLELRDETARSGQDASLQRLAQLLPLRGYVRPLREAIHHLRREFLARSVSQDPLLLALAARGRSPGDYSSKPRVRLQPGARTDWAMKRILLQLLEVVERNEPGVREDLDPEFLHDYRVAWRRTRSLLTQIKRVFPEAPLEGFREELRWISMLTSPVRDMDVYLLELPRYRASIPEALRPGLEPLHALVLEEKRAGHRALVQALDGRRYKDFMARWRAFLQAPPPAYTEPVHADRPVIEVASRRIWKLFRHALREGRAIDQTSPPEALHELRKTCKKLRYLLEAFSSLYPREPLEAAIRDLKRLQDNLGEYQDLAVHRATLEHLRQRLGERGELTELTARAMEALLRSLEIRARRVREAFAGRFTGFDSKPTRKRFRRLFKEGHHP